MVHFAFKNTMTNLMKIECDTAVKTLIVTKIFVEIHLSYNHHHTLIKF